MSAPIQASTRVDISQVWRGRAAVRISNGEVACTVLRKGGSLAEFRSLVSADPQNLLWESPWFGPDIPLSDVELASRYGDVNSGRFLHHYTGHALCLDGFGPASEGEMEQGGGLHGEAIRAEWDFAQTAEHELRAKAVLPNAQLALERVFTLHPNEAVLRVEETVRNLSAATRNIHWVQHATVGTPAFDTGSRMVTSASEGLTWPLDYEGRNTLQLDTPFTWPAAPGASGATIDLAALFPIARTGFVAALKQPNARRFAFVAAQNPKTESVLAYLYPSAVFPWLTLWEENQARDAAPWNGVVRARGLEFGTTPFPLGNEIVDAQGPVMGMRTAHPLAPGDAVTARWLLVAAQVPAAYSDLSDIAVEEDAVTLCCAQGKLRVTSSNVEFFLAGEKA